MDYVNPKYRKRASLYTQKQMIFIKAFKKKLNQDCTLQNYELNRPLPKGKNKKVIGVMKNELVGKIMREFLRLRAKSYSYFIEDGSEDKKAKGTYKCLKKRELNNKNCLEDHKEFLKSNKLILKA